MPLRPRHLAPAIFGLLFPLGGCLTMPAVGADIAVGKTLHRIDEAIVLAEVRKAGFVLEAESNFLRDPADTREESSGDAKIPTDKFALRFVKP